MLRLYCAFEKQKSVTFSSFQQSQFSNITVGCSLGSKASEIWRTCAILLSSNERDAGSLNRFIWALATKQALRVVQLHVDEAAHVIDWQAIWRNLLIQNRDPKAFNLLFPEIAALCQNLCQSGQSPPVRRSNLSAGIENGFICL